MTEAMKRMVPNAGLRLWDSPKAGAQDMPSENLAD
jgi:hypothetical protein